MLHKHSRTALTDIQMPNTKNADIAPDHAIGETVRIVVDKLLVRIQSGEYPPDSRLPSVWLVWVKINKMSCK